jgi:hypothetical protein
MERTAQRITELGGWQPADTWGLAATIGAPLLREALNAEAEATAPTVVQLGRDGRPLFGQDRIERDPIVYWPIAFDKVWDRLRKGSAEMEKERPRLSLPATSHDAERLVSVIAASIQSTAPPVWSAAIDLGLRRLDEELRERNDDNDRKRSLSLRQVYGWFGFPDITCRLQC